MKEKQEKKRLRKIKAKLGEGIERKSKDIQCNIMAKQRIQTKKGWKKQANARGSNCKENLTKLKRTVESKEKKP